MALSPGDAVRPRLRSATRSAPTLPAVDALIAKANLGGRVAYAVADARTGQLLETRSHLRAMPPASVTKAVTALYALEHLGPDYRYRTRLLATGPISDGVLQGDLVLEASGDPVLMTDDLGRMTEDLEAAGVRKVAGKFLVFMPKFAEAPHIDHSQPHQVSYNPGVAGLNLNLNRVHFEWKREGKDHAITMQARGAKYRPACNTSHMEIVDRPGPVYDFMRTDGVDRWTVARGALGSKGARWLPVRDPVDYALDAFRTLARSKDISLPNPQRTARPAQGTVLAEEVSPEMSQILRRMLKVSTNLTAEVVGQTATLASGKRPGSIRGSATAMSDWLGEVSGARRPDFVDHSGLGVANDISPADMVAALVHAGPDGALASLMKPWRFRTSGGGVDRNNPVEVPAKTGTLNFVSGLGGFIKPPEGRALAFAIFAADEPRRMALSRAERERAPGAKSWSRRARTLDDALIKRWVSLYV